MPQSLRPQRERTALVDTLVRHTQGVTGRARCPVQFGVVVRAMTLRASGHHPILHQFNKFLGVDRLLPHGLPLGIDVGIIGMTIKAGNARNAPLQIIPMTLLAPCLVPLQGVQQIRPMVSGTPWTPRRDDMRRVGGVTGETGWNAKTGIPLQVWLVTMDACTILGSRCHPLHPMFFPINPPRLMGILGVTTGVVTGLLGGTTLEIITMTLLAHRFVAFKIFQDKETVILRFFPQTVMRIT